MSNILTDILGLFKRKKFRNHVKPDDVLVIGIAEEPDIEGVASPVPYKDVKLVKYKDFLASAECENRNVPYPVFDPSAGVFLNTTTDPITGDCFDNFRRLKSLSLNLTINENGEYVEFDCLAEANTASNIGTGEGVFAQKVGQELQFKSLIAGDNIDISSTADEITISSTIELDTFGAVYFVSPDGDDLTGSVGDISKPWQTISAARDQAVIDALPSSLIYVWPGVYDETELQYQDGNLYLSAGAEIKPTNQINGDAGTASMVAVDQGTQTFTFVNNYEANLSPGQKFRIFSGPNAGTYTIVTATDVGPNTEVVVVEPIPSPTVSGYLNTTEAVFLLGYTPISAPASSFSTKFSIFGEGIIDVVQTVDGDWAGNIVFMGGTSELFCQCKTWRMEQGTPVFTLDDAVLTLNANLFEIYGGGGYAATIRDASNTTFNVDRIVSNGSWAFFARQGSTGNFNGQCVVKANRITQTGGFPPLQVSFMNGGRISFDCPIVESENFCISTNFVSGGQIIFNSNLIGVGPSGNGVITAGMSGGEIVVNGNITVDNGRALIFSGSGGELFLNGDMTCTNGNDVDLVSVNGSTVRLNGKIKNTNGGALCSGVAKISGTLLIDTLKIISDTDSIDATTPQDIIVNHSLAANQALDANITNIVAGSAVIIDPNVQ